MGVKDGTPHRTEFNMLYSSAFALGASLSAVPGIAFGCSAAPGDQPAAASSAGPDTQLAAPRWFPRGVLRQTDNQLKRTLAVLFSRPIPKIAATTFESLEDASALVAFDSPRNRSIVETYVAELSSEEALAALNCRDSTDCDTESFHAFALKAWRRPLTETERAWVSELFEWTNGRSEEAWRTVLTEVLAHPAFHFISILGTGSGSTFGLTQFEQASLIAFELTSLPPDAPLLAAAYSGQLSDSTARQSHAVRLWESEPGKAKALLKMRDWFEIHDRASDFDVIPLSVQLDETNRLIEDVLFTEDADITQLLTADYSFVTPELGDFYGIDTEGSGTQRVSLLATRRRGLLHHMSWLRSFSGSPSYARRGTVPPNLLCESIPDPPEALNVETPEPTPNLSRRQQMTELTAAPACNVCHKVMNPFAFAFEHYDGRGFYVESSSQSPIDSKGSVVTPNNYEFQFEDSMALVEQLAAHPAFVDCFNKRMVSHWSGLTAEHAAARSYLDHTPASRNAREAMMTFVGSDFFVNRSAP